MRSLGLEGIRVAQCAQSALASQRVSMFEPWRSSLILRNLIRATTRLGPGDFVWANVDTAMMDDLLGPRVVIADQITKLGNAIWDNEKVVIISDHYSPAANILSAGGLIPFLEKRYGNGK